MKPFLLIICLVIGTGATTKLKVTCEFSNNDDDFGEVCHLSGLTIKNDTELEVTPDDKTKTVKTLLYSASTLDMIPPVDKSFPNVKILEISESTINIMTKDFFQHVPEINSLILDSVKIHRIPIDFFTPLKKLEEIQISDSDLEYLIQPIFDPLRNTLKTLKLSGNKIDAISPVVFKHLNLSSFEVKETCAENDSNGTLNEHLENCYANFDQFSNKQVEKLDNAVIKAMEDIKLVEKTLNQKMEKLGEISKEVEEMKQNVTESQRAQNDEIQAIIQDQQMTIYILIFVSFLSTLAFIGMCLVTKKYLN